MAKEVKYGVIGLGRFGLAVAQSLIESGEDVIAVDVDESRLGLISDQTENVYIIGQITEDSLIEAGLDKCEVVIIGIGKNIEASLLAALHCIHLKVPRVIAKANSAEHAQILKMIGAEVIFPEMDTAHRLARTLKNRMLMDFFSVGSGFSIIQATGLLLGGKRILDHPGDAACEARWPDGRRIEPETQVLHQHHRREQGRQGHSRHHAGSGVREGRRADSGRKRFQPGEVHEHVSIAASATYVPVSREGCRHVCS